VDAPFISIGAGTLRDFFVYYNPGVLVVAADKRPFPLRPFGRSGPCLSFLKYPCNPSCRQQPYKNDPLGHAQLADCGWPKCWRNGKARRPIIPGEKAGGRFCGKTTEQKIFASCGLTLFFPYGLGSRPENSPGHSGLAPIDFPSFLFFFSFASPRFPSFRPLARFLHRVWLFPFSFLCRSGSSAMGF